MRTYKAGKGYVCLSFDDYHPLNLKIDEILHAQGIEATFFIETGTVGAMQQIKQLFERGHEIGSHTIHHPADIKAIHQVECVSELEGSKKMIESVTHRPCTSFAYPRGRYNDDIVAMVKRAGYESARGTRVLETEWTDPFTAGTTIHLYEGRKEYNGRPLEVLIPFYLKHVVDHGGTFSLWGHAREIDRDGLWTTLEKAVLLLGKYIEV